MARDSSGKWVARAGATGGGRTYRGQTPVNWYAALVLIVVIGLVSVAWARYQYRNPAAKPAAAQPAVGVTWYSGFVFDICGTLEPSPPASANSARVGMYTSGSGVMVIAPKTSAQAGANATLGQFVDGYPGLVLTQSTIQSPGTKLLKNGDTCPAGTPDAGKAGTVTVGYWPTFSTKHPEIQTGDPITLRPGSESRISMAFLPPGTAPAQPPGTVVEALFKSVSSATTSSSVPATATTVPSTATTLPASATTTPSLGVQTPTTAPHAATTAPTTTPRATSTTKPTG
jgi:hypothetical protein